MYISRKARIKILNLTQDHPASAYFILVSILVLVLASHDKADTEHVRLLRDCGVPCYNAELVLTASLKQRIDLPQFLINPPTTR